VYGGVKEKDLNLDIAKRLNTLLKAEGIKTYMTREKDITVGFILDLTLRTKKKPICLSAFITMPGTAKLQGP